MQHQDATSNIFKASKKDTRTTSGSLCCYIVNFKHIVHFILENINPQEKSVLKCLFNKAAAPWPAT